ncbi:MAG: hypothetical protein RL111_1173 [Pseudomonadota bacterium]|jgi:predicted metal-dependent hydrolase
MTTTTFDQTTPTTDTHMLVVRRLLVDLNQPFDRHWNGGSAFRTAFANALSMSFPMGEQFFIDAVQKGLALLPSTPEHDALRKEIKGFVGQEATHRHLHARFNQILTEQGLVNHLQNRIQRRIEIARKLSANSSERGKALRELAVTAAYEHYTAVLGEQILAIQDAPGDWFLHAQPQVKTLWRWHASEESEHKCIAHDLYQILGGSHSGRLRWFAYVTVLFTLDVTRQTLNNLWHDKTLFSWRTWRDGFEFFLGRHGLVWRCAGPVAQYLKRDFHPMRVGDSQLARDWLQQHQHQWSAVNQRHQVS